MTTDTLLKKAAAKDKSVVVLSLEEYQRLLIAGLINEVLELRHKQEQIRKSHK